MGRHRSHRQYGAESRTGRCGYLGFLSAPSDQVSPHRSVRSCGSRKDLLRLLERGPAGVLRIYGNLMTRANVLAIAQYARAAGWLVMLGGPEPSNYPSEYLTAGADLIVAGEGEIAVERLM